MAEREILDAVCQKLSDDEQKMVTMRLAGCDWAEIAMQCQATPEAARKRMTPRVGSGSQRAWPDGIPGWQTGRICVRKQVTRAAVHGVPSFSRFSGMIRQEWTLIE